jgi:hypothetical protein
MLVSWDLNVWFCWIYILELLADASPEVASAIWRWLSTELGLIKQNPNPIKDQGLARNEAV